MPLGNTSANPDVPAPFIFNSGNRAIVVDTDADFGTASPSVPGPGNRMTDYCYVGQQVIIHNRTYTVLSVGPLAVTVSPNPPTEAGVNLFCSIGVAQWRDNNFPVAEVRGQMDSSTAIGIGMSGAFRLLECVRVVLSNPAMLDVERKVLDPTNQNITQLVTLTFTDATHFNVVGTGTGNPVGVVYGGSAVPIAFNGWQIRVSGAALAGNTIKIQAQTFEIGFTGSGPNLFTQLQVEVWADNGLSIRGFNTGLGNLQLRDRVDGHQSFWGQGARLFDASVSESSAHLGCVTGNQNAGYGIGFSFNQSADGAPFNSRWFLNKYGFAVSLGNAENIVPDWTVAGVGAVLMLDACTAVAGTAPIKMKAGTALAAAEAGTFEYTDVAGVQALTFTKLVAGVPTRVVLA